MFIFETILRAIIMWGRIPLQVGTSNDDALYVGKGNEVIDGGDGIDVLSIDYGRMNRELTFDSAKGRWILNADTSSPVELVNIENVRINDVVLSLNDARLTQLTQHQSTDGADNMIGNDLGYTLYGYAGDDTLTGNGGHDTLYGGKGVDTAVYRGLRSDYVVEFDSVVGAYAVKDLIENRDGTDAVYSTERLRFADGEFNIDDLAIFKPGTDNAEYMGSNPFGYFIGNGGDDTLYGGDGVDTAVYRGLRSDYVVEFDSVIGAYAVKDLIENRDGTDVLISTERLRFADGEFNTEDLATLKPGTDNAEYMYSNPFGYFIGNGGDDYLYGGAGIDTAVYRGLRSDYVVEFNSAISAYTVKDLMANRDGTDDLVWIERLRFADGEFNTQDLATFKPGTDNAEYMYSNPFGYFIGNGGDDYLYGGTGVDTAVYRGLRSDYVVEFDSVIGAYTVKDLIGNRDGTDVLSSTEQLRFADGEFNIDDLATLKPITEPPPPTSYEDMLVVGWDDLNTTDMLYGWQQTFVTLDLVGVPTQTSAAHSWDNFSL
jgi:Ca2+-binding RTX toxin-like protein